MNFLMDGTAEISKILCFQMMKPIKLLLKNCMCIGGEAAAEYTAFIFPLIESCKLNNLHSSRLHEIHSKDCDKKALLPCYYKQ